MVFVKLHQNRRGHHQEVSEGHGDGVGHHREALTQTAQTLKKETRAEFYKAIKIKQEEPPNTKLERVILQQLSGVTIAYLWTTGRLETNQSAFDGNHFINNEEKI